MEESELVKKLAKGKIGVEELDITFSQHELGELNELIAKSQESLFNIKAKIKVKSKITKRFKEDLSEEERKSLKGRVKEISELIKADELTLKNTETVIAEYLTNNKKELKPLQFRNELNYKKIQGEVEFFVCDSFEDIRPQWDAFLTRCPAHSSYHRSVWLNVLKDYSGFAIYLFGIKVDGEIVAAVPTLFMKSFLFGENQISVPYVNYGGVLSVSIEYSNALFSGMKKWLLKNQVDYFELRTTQSEYKLPMKDQKCSMILSLPDSDESLERGLSAKVRAQYKKASNFRPIITFGGVELLDEFYSIFSRNMRDLGTPVYSKSLFKKILEESEIESFLCVVKINGKPVSTAFLSGYRDMLEIPWASTLRSANKFDSNMWMYRMILKEAIRRSYLYFDFGRTTIDSNTYKFKKQWGAKSVRHYWYYVLTNDSLPEANPDNPKYRLFISLWKMLPVWVANRIGPHIVKNIP